MSLRSGESGSRSINRELEAKQDRTGNSFSVDSLPEAEKNVGRTVFVTDGNEGSPCAAISDGENWLVITTGTSVSAE